MRPTEICGPLVVSRDAERRDSGGEKRADLPHLRPQHRMTSGLRAPKDGILHTRSL